MSKIRENRSKGSKFLEFQGRDDTTKWTGGDGVANDKGMQGE